MRVFHLLCERARLFGPLAPILGVIHEGRWHAATPITRRQETRHAALIFLLRRVRQLWSDVRAAVGNVGYNADSLTSWENYSRINVGLREVRCDTLANKLITFARCFD
jgi:hypothetical protein